MIGPAFVVSSLRPRSPLQRWYLIHETPGYMLLAAVVLAVAGPASSTENGTKHRVTSHYAAARERSCETRR